MPVEMMTRAELEAHAKRLETVRLEAERFVKKADRALDMSNTLKRLTNDAWYPLRDALAAVERESC